jgi:hypothetical protein
MESDFTTRQHLDSVVPFSDPSMGELLHRYRNPPVEPKMPQSSGTTEGPSQASNAYISNMLGQLQGVVQSMASNKEPSNLAGSGLQLSVNADILRWMVVLAFAIVLVVVIFQFMNRRKAKNPLKKRLKRLENEIRALHGRKNPVEALEQDEDEDEN